jgi:cytochrome c oxidase cbb3-type subunit I/II
LREGGKYNDNWHFNHFWNPQSISAGSIMPGYKWLFDNEAMDNATLQKKMEVMKTLGVPYDEPGEAQIANALKDLRVQAIKIEESLKNDPDFVKSYDNSKKKAEARGEKFVPMNQREIVALIAYIQRLGTDIKVKQ